MGSFLSSIIAGANPTLGGDINQSGQIAGFGQSLGEGDLQNASGFYNDILSGNSAKQAAVLAPEISNIQKQGQQQIATAGQFGNRSGGTNASAQNNIDTQRGQVSDMIAKLTGERRFGLSSIGSNALNTGLSANAQQADQSQQQMQNFQNSILGKGISDFAGNGLERCGSWIGVLAWRMLRLKRDCKERKDGGRTAKRRTCFSGSSLPTSTRATPITSACPMPRKTLKATRKHSTSSSRPLTRCRRSIPRTITQRWQSISTASSSGLNRLRALRSPRRLLPCPPRPLQASGQPAAPPATAPAHPFAHNPVYGDIIKGLDALGTHLKGFAQPNGPKQPLPKLSSFAAVPSEGDLAAQDAATKAKEAEKLAELRNQGQLDVAKARAQFTSMSTPQKAFLNRWAVDHGADDFNGLSSDQQSLALKAFKGANAPASHLQLKAENGNLYTFDPATGKMTFKAKLGDVRKTQGVRFVTNTLTGEVTEVPYTTYTSKESGEPIADDSGAPIGAADDQKAPVSAQAPSLDAVNSKIAAGNTSSKKLNKGKPVSSNAPRVVAHTASLMDKSDAAQYTKIAEDANKKRKHTSLRERHSQALLPLRAIRSLFIRGCVPMCRAQAG